MPAPIITPLSDLLSWVVTRWKPTVAQVKAWMNSYRHKDDKIAVDDLETSLKNYILSLGNSGTGTPLYPTGTQRFLVTDATQAQFTPTIDITNVPVEKICVSNGVRVPFNKVANKIVLDDAAHAGDVVYIDVI